LAIRQSELSFVHTASMAACSSIITAATSGRAVKVRISNHVRGSQNRWQAVSSGSGDSVTVGTPTVANASVSAKVINHGRGDKVKIIKFRRRKHHRKQAGHRQNYTELEITSINAG